MKKNILVIISIFGIVASLSAVDTATITRVTGKVEIQMPDAEWVAATAGTRITNGTTISTGFNSGATLDLGSSEIQIRQLTRMELGELIQQQGTIKTDLNLKVGRIRAEVKPVEGLEHDFTIRSSVSTASVRGTTVDNEDGENVGYQNGSGSVKNNAGEEVIVDDGEAVEVESEEEGGDIVTAEEVFTAQTEVETDTTPLPEAGDVDSGDGGDGGEVVVPPAPDPTTTTVTITWN